MLTLPKNSRRVLANVHFPPTEIKMLKNAMFTISSFFVAMFRRQIFYQAEHCVASGICLNWLSWYDQNMTSEYAETCRSIIILRLILSDDQRTNLFCVWFAIHGPIIKLRRKNNWIGNAFGRDNYEPFTSKETGKCPENACDLQCSKTTRIPLYEDQNPIDYWLLIVCVSHRKPKIRQTACRWFALRINFHFKNR